MLFGLLSTPNFGDDWYGPERRGGAVPPTLAMWAFLASLAVFFVAAFVLFLYYRIRGGPGWPRPGAVELPRVGLLISTAVLLASSASLHWAQRSIRGGRQRGLRTGLLLTMALGVVFLACQGLNWAVLSARGLGGDANMLVALFYALTILHFVHVLGGLAPLAFVTARSFGGRYSAERHTGVRLCSMYWHFLDGVWVLMCAALFLPA
ncbi:MAG TPA: heme-copper oxidase subunit III [Phycisphaerae bacterium]|nr:heme-copper oxidase subunit III [Phycisphaerae bacterium]